MRALNLFLFPLRFPDAVFRSIHLHLRWICLPPLPSDPTFEEKTEWRRGDDFSKDPMHFPPPLHGLHPLSHCRGT